MATALLDGRFGSGYAPSVVPSPLPVSGWVEVQYDSVLQTDEAMIPELTMRLPIIDGRLCRVDGEPGPVEVQATDDLALFQEGARAKVTIKVAGARPLAYTIPLPAGQTVELHKVAAGGPDEDGRTIFVAGVAPAVGTALAQEAADPNSEFRQSLMGTIGTEVDAAVAPYRAEVQAVPGQVTEQVETEVPAVMARDENIRQTAINAVQVAVDEQAPIADPIIASALADPATDTGTLARQTFAARVGVDARLHNLPTGTDNAAPALNAAADAARAAQVPVIVPPGTYYIDSTVNFRHLDVQAYGRIIVRHTDGPGVIVGDVATQRNELVIRLKDVSHAGATFQQWDFPYPAIQAVGLMGGTLDVGNCTLLELYANDSVQADRSLAYNNIILGRIQHLRLWGAGSMGWINENVFLGGSYNRITIGGDYAHNNNKWIKPAVEGPGSIVDVQYGYSNMFEDIRVEGSDGFRFGPASYANTAILLWQDGRNPLGGTAAVDDQAWANTVTNRTMLDVSRHTIFRIDPAAPIFDKASPIGGDVAGLPVPSVGGGNLATRSQWNYFIDVTIPVVDPHNPGAVVSSTLGPTSRIRRLLLHSDVKIVRPSIQGLDADGNVIDPAVTPFLVEYGGLKKGTQQDYDPGAATMGVQILISSPLVRFLRIRARPADVLPGTQFRHLTLTAYLHSSEDSGVVEQARRAAARPLYSATKPAQGLAWPGTVVQGPSGSWRSVARKDTALAVAAETDATQVTLADGAGIAAGDVIGIRLDDGRTHWASVSSVTGAAVTLSVALPGPAAVGVPVGTTRWA